MMTTRSNDTAQRNRQHSTARRLVWRIALILTFTALLTLPSALPASENVAGNGNGGINFANLSESIDQTILKEQESRDAYAAELRQVKASEKADKSSLSSLKVQYSVYSNLAATPETEVGSLEQAFSDNMTVQNTIRTTLSDLIAKKDRAKLQMAQTDDQIRLNTDQLNAITADRKPQDGLSGGLIDKTRELLDLLNKKKEILAELSSIYDDYVKEYSILGDQFASLAAMLDRGIILRKKKDLLQRKTNPLFSKPPVEMMKDVGELLTLPKRLITLDYWSKSLGIRERSDFSYVVILVLLFVFFQYVLSKSLKGLVRIRSLPFFSQSRWGTFSLRLFERSLYLTGNVILFSVCDSLLHLRLKFPVVELVEQILTVLLLCQWALDFLRLFPDAMGGFPPKVLTGKLKQIVRLVLYFSLINLTALWFLTPDNVLLVMTRMVFAVLIGLELFSLGRILNPCMADSSLPSQVQQAVCYLPKAGYVFLFFGMIMDLSGYVQLAVFLSVSFGKTLLLAMWSTLALLMILEFKRSGQIAEDRMADDPDKTTLNAHWYLTLFYGLGWLALSLMGLLYVWSGKEAAFKGVFHWYSTPVTIGNLKFSLMGLTLTVLLLLVTYNVVRLWKQVFQKRILKDSGMDIGVQESITTISVYLIWIAGILLAMNVFGLNMTSITVVLGALGIGIGFGLQNIFNNFLSGIILLFERPIKVGDDVEINGLWANVKKINVRSTVVQTYDNATLIIPNSDFISSTVTNWSFSDKRIRRSITVGVAYGSDLELVKASMLEAADKVSRVAKLPKPDVIFKDFGDSALVFVLRFWTRVEYYVSVESAVRFEIDRLFRERKIEICFPQQDLHIRSVDADLVLRHAGVGKNTKEDSVG